MLKKLTHLKEGSEGKKLYSKGRIQVLLQKGDQGGELN